MVYLLVALFYFCMFRKQQRWLVWDKDTVRASLRSRHRTISEVSQLAVYFLTKCQPRLAAESLATLYESLSSSFWVNRVVSREQCALKKYAYGGMRGLCQKKLLSLTQPASLFCQLLLVGVVQLPIGHHRPGMIQSEMFSHTSIYQTHVVERKEVNGHTTYSCLCHCTTSYANSLSQSNISYLLEMENAYSEKSGRFTSQTFLNRIQIYLVPNSGSSHVCTSLLSPLVGVITITLALLQLTEPLAVLLLPHRSQPGQAQIYLQTRQLTVAFFAFSVLRIWSIPGLKQEIMYT